MEESVSQKEKERAEEAMIEQAFQELLNDYLATKHRKRVEIITKAFNFANQAHKGIKRRSGEPYIMHPIAVAKIVCNEIGLGSTSICAALLHDVVEDTEWTCEDLKKEGFPDEIIEAVRCVTKLSDEEDYEEYIGRCATNPLAIAVKIHDLTDNMDVRRMPCIGEKEISRLKKYLKAYHRLMPFYMNH